MGNNRPGVCIQESVLDRSYNCSSSSSNSSSSGDSGGGSSGGGGSSKSNGGGGSSRVALEAEREREREREMFYLTTHSTHFMYGYLASGIWLRIILIVIKETRCRHIGYSFRLAARVLLYAPSHRQDNIYLRPLLHQSWSTGWNEK